MKIKINPDEIQMYLSRNIAVLPHVREKYLRLLKKQSANGTVCLLPSTIFELYHIDITRKINQLISTLPEHVQRQIARAR